MPTKNRVKKREQRVKSTVHESEVAGHDEILEVTRRTKQPTPPREVLRLSSASRKTIVKLTRRLLADVGRISGQPVDMALIHYGDNDGVLKITYFV